MLDDNIINNIISQSITALHFCVEPKCSLVEAYHNISDNNLWICEEFSSFWKRKLVRGKTENMEIRIK